MRALAGEEERHLIAINRRLGREERTHRVDAAHRVGTALDGIGGPAQTCGRIGQRRGHQCKSCTCIGFELFRQARRDIARRDHGRRRTHGGGGLAQFAGQRGSVISREQVQLMRPVAAEGLLMFGQVAALIFLQHRMEIGATEAEGRHPGATRRFTPRHPGPVLGGNIERALGKVCARIRLFDMQGRRDHPVMQCQRQLDHARAARSRLGVANHRLDRADTAELLHIRIVAERLGKAGNLRPVPDDSAGAMRFDQAHGRRRNPGTRIGADQSAFLTFGARRGQRQILAVRRSSNAAQHGVNPVPLSLGLIQTAQHHHRQPFGNGDAIGTSVKGAAAPTRGQCPCLGEGQKVERVLETVSPADNHHVRGAILQLPRGHHHGGKRRATGGIDGEIHPTQIKAVGHAARDDIQQDAGEAVLGPFRQALGSGFGHFTVDRGQRGTHGVALAKRPGAAADPDDDRGFAAQRLILDHAILEPGVFQRLSDNLQRQQLQRFDRRHGVGRNAVFDRVEFKLINEAAPFRIGLVGRIAVGIVITAPIPTAFRHFFNRIDAVDDILPIGGKIARFGQDRPHAGDGDARSGTLFDQRARGFGRGQRSGQNLGRAYANRFMKCGNRGGRVVQAGGLSDHVDPMLQLIGGGNGNQPRRTLDLAEFRVAIHPLGGDARTAHVEFFQLVLDLIGVDTRLQQRLLLREEFFDNRAFHNAGCVPRTAFQQHGTLRAKA